MKVITDDYIRIASSEYLKLGPNLLYLLFHDNFLASFGPYRLTIYVYLITCWTISIVLCCIVLCCIVLCCIVLCCIVLCCIVLCYVVLHCIALYM